jgi:hypothetical protein
MVQDVETPPAELHQVLVTVRAFFTPFFAETERKQAGCQHRWFFAPVQYCDNRIFPRRAALNALGERLTITTKPSASAWPASCGNLE